MRGEQCLYNLDSSLPCKEDKTLDFDFCRNHMKTPRGRQHAIDVINRDGLSLAREIREGFEHAQVLPEKDIHTTTLERQGEALERILDWETECRNRLYAIPTEDWRYLSRERTEQKRSELVTYENAQERVLRALTATSKMAIKEKSIALGRAQAEMMVRILTGVVVEMRLDAHASSMARQLILEKLRAEANLPSRVQANLPRVIEGAVVNGDS